MNNSFILFNNLIDDIILPDSLIKIKNDLLKEINILLNDEIFDFITMEYKLFDLVKNFIVVFDNDINDNLNKTFCEKYRKIPLLNIKIEENISTIKEFVKNFYKILKRTSNTTLRSPQNYALYNTLINTELISNSISKNDSKNFIAYLISELINSLSPINTYNIDIELSKFFMLDITESKINKYELSMIYYNNLLYLFETINKISLEFKKFYSYYETLYKDTEDYRIIKNKYTNQKNLILVSLIVLLISLSFIKEIEDYKLILKETVSW